MEGGFIALLGFAAGCFFVIFVGICVCCWSAKRWNRRSRNESNFAMRLVIRREVLPQNPNPESSLPPPNYEEVAFPEIRMFNSAGVSIITKEEEITDLPPSYEMISIGTIESPSKF